jgi:PAS domain S-box-containing protein
MRKRVLMVVEDELIVAEDLTHWLTSLGYTVGARAATGRGAVQCCEETRPDLILMDILLPGDMDGIQAAEIIRRRFDIPVVYITASSDDATLSRAKITEPFGYILKPFDERGLYTTIEMALYKHQSEKRIRNSEERFRLLYDYAPVAFQSLDADGHLLRVNNAWQALFGYSQEEVHGHWFGEFLAPGCTERFIALTTQFRNSPVTDSMALDCVARDGTVMTATFKGSIAVDQRGMFEMTQCVLESRTKTSGDAPVDAAGMEAEMSKSAPPLPLPGSWVLTSLEGVVLALTPALELLLGQPADRVCGRRLDELCTPGMNVSEILAQIKSAGTLAPHPLQVRYAGGGSLDAMVSGFVLHGQDGAAPTCCLHLQRS